MADTMCIQLYGTRRFCVIYIGIWVCTGALTQVYGLKCVAVLLYGYAWVYTLIHVIHIYIYTYVNDWVCSSPHEYDRVAVL
jgi:hypothetical protein